MNKRIKVLSAIITALLCIAAMTIGVCATDEIPTTAPVAPTSAPTSAPVVDPTSTPTSAPVVDPTTAPTTGDGEYTDPDPEPTTTPEGDITEPTSGNYVDSYINEDGYYYYDEDEMVNNLSDSAGNVSDYTDLYDTSNFDESALKQTKWDNITLDTTKADSDAGDFSAIKENTEKEDDGQWIIYTGFVLIGLSLIGILYFIIATATYKKKLKELKKRELRQRHRDHSRPRDDYGDSSEYPTQSDYHRRYQKRYAPAGQSYSERKRRNADTAEINLPRGYKAKH